MDILVIAVCDKPELYAKGYEYIVYKYGVWPSHSVLAGQMKRSFMGAYKTLLEAQQAYPQASCHL